MRDDVRKLPIPASAKRYSRMKGSPKKQELYPEVAGDLLHQDEKGKFRSHQLKQEESRYGMDVSPQALVSQLLDEEYKGITIRYEHPRTGAIKEKTFPSQEAMEKWTEKNEVKVVSYSKDPN
jgi:hypothetical protein